VEYRHSFEGSCADGRNEGRGPEGRISGVLEALDRRVGSLILKRLISEADGDTNRSDLNSAIALSRTLTFPSMEEWNTKLSPIASSRKLSDTTGVRESSNISKDSEVFAEKTDAIFTRLRTLCRLASSPTFSANVSVMDNAIYSDQVYLVAKEITSITNTPITSKIRPITTSCCIAALIIVEKCLRGGSFTPVS
jgi:hypothetical protein